MPTTTLPPAVDTAAAVLGATQVIAYSRYAYATDAERVAALRDVLARHGITDLDVTPEPGERCTCRNLPAAHPAGAPGCESAPPTLVVSEWLTVCSACGRGADPTETAHRTVLETRTLAGHPAGCGAVFEQIAAAKHANRTSEAFTPGMRPDLPYVGRWPR